MQTPSKLKVFLRGIANIINIFPKTRPYQERFGSDENLLTSDWYRVGQGLKKSMDTFDEFHPPNN